MTVPACPYGRQMTLTLANHTAWLYSWGHKEEEVSRRSHFRPGPVQEEAEERNQEQEQDGQEANGWRW